MNERIKELLKQSSYEIIETDGAPIICQELNPEKFAELIVRECAGVVFKKVGPKSALDVLEHFGVEE